MTDRAGFDFETNENSLAYCRLVLVEIMEQFGMSEDEALGRVNRHWRGQSFVRSDEVDALTHEMPAEMARFIVYEPESRWWVPGEELRIRPYP